MKRLSEFSTPLPNRNVHMNELTYNHVYLLGDTHRIDFDGILKHYSLSNCAIIHVGDVGMGYQHPARDYINLQGLEDYCKENNCHLYLIRGNHDRPECWLNSYFTEAFEHIHFVKDYTNLVINGNKFLFVGGATSIDRSFNVLGITYFAGEEFPDPTNVDPCVFENVDVLITHAKAGYQPPYDFANIEWCFQRDALLKEDLIKEGKTVNAVYDAVKDTLKLHAWGHMHMSVDDLVNGVRWRCLDINEVWDITHIL